MRNIAVTFLFASSRVDNDSELMTQLDLTIRGYRGGDVRFSVPSRSEDPDHALHLTMETDDQMEVTRLLETVGAYSRRISPSRFGLELKAVGGRCGHTVNYDQLTQQLGTAYPVPIMIRQDPAPVHSSAKGG